MSYKKIKKTDNKKGKLLKKQDDKHYSKIVFSFLFFCTDSISFRDFNNFYANEQESKKAVKDFFETIKLLSNLEPEELFTANMKKQYHYNEFTDDLIIDRIEDILVKGYKMPQSKIDEFERNYFEFSFGNGRRVIGTKVYDNIFQILFIDCNHLVCIDSSRNVNLKNSFNYPGAFGNINNEIDSKQIEREELVELLIDSARSVSYSSIKDFVDDYDDLLVNV